MSVGGYTLNRLVPRMWQRMLAITSKCSHIPTPLADMRSGELCSWSFANWSSGGMVKSSASDGKSWASLAGSVLGFEEARERR